MENIGRRFEKTAKKESNVPLRRTLGSGNLWFDKGDMEAENFLLELKATAKESFSLKREVIRKIQREANITSKHWGMLLQINGLEVLVVDPSWLSVLNEYD